MRGIEIRLRSTSDGTGKTLGEVPFADLDRVIPTLKAWGLEIENSPTEVIVGQFCLDDTGAYFEVVIGNLGGGYEGC